MTSLASNRKVPTNVVSSIPFTESCWLWKEECTILLASNHHQSFLNTFCLEDSKKTRNFSGHTRHTPTKNNGRRWLFPLFFFFRWINCNRTGNEAGIEARSFSGSGCWSGHREMMGQIIEIVFTAHSCSKRLFLLGMGEKWIFVGSQGSNLVNSIVKNGACLIYRQFFWSMEKHPWAKGSERALVEGLYYSWV